MRTITTIVAALMLVTVAFSMTMAGNAAKAKAAEKIENASFKGTLVCLGCDLKMTEGAHAACKTYGHKHALKTEDGRYINFLENQYSEDLLKSEKYQGKKIEAEGTFFANADMLDVHSFTVDGKKMGWCQSCKKMDSCPYKQSDSM